MTQEILLAADRSADVGHTALPLHYRTLLIRLHDQNVPFIIIGGIAVALAGYNRLTRDLDTVCRDLDAMVNTLYELNFRIISHPVRSEPGALVVFGTPEAAREALRNSNKPSFKCIHQESRLEFDVWIESPDPARLPVAEIEAQAVAAVLSGVPIKRACAEHLIIMKKIALADNPSRKGRDGSDIDFLEAYLKEHGPELR